MYPNIFGPLGSNSFWPPNCLSNRRGIVMRPSGNAQLGDRVSFRISDAFLPEPNEVLANLTVEAETNGVIVEFSDSGNSPRMYAVVQITGQQKILVPVNAIHVVDYK